MGRRSYILLYSFLLLQINKNESKKAYLLDICMPDLKYYY